MSAEVTSRRATPPDRIAILALLEATFGEGGLVDDEAFWLWKHERSPFGRSPMRVAEAGGEIIGLRTMMPWRWHAESRPISSVRAVDTVTHPGWQGRGIFRRLTLELLAELEDEGTAFVFNSPNRKSLPGYLGMGWRLVGCPPLWLRVRGPLRAVMALLRPGPTSDTALPLDGEPFQDLIEDSRLERLTGPWEADARFHTPRTPEYLTWRYLETPRLSYQARWRFDDLSGAAVVFRRKLRRGLVELMLSEVLVTPDTRGVQLATEILRSVRREIDPDLLTAVAASGTPEARALRRAGFVRAPVGPQIVLRTMDDSLPNPLSADRWRWSLGDLELF